MSDHMFISKKNSDNIYATGYNYYGQLGKGNTTNNTSFSIISSLKLSEIKQIFPTHQNTFVVKNDDSLWATGYNSGYGLVTNSTSSGNVSSFTKSKYTGGNIKQIESYSGTAIMLLNDGTVWGIGDNSYGQLGTGNTTKRTVWTKTSQISDVIKICIANSFVLALKSDGTVWGIGMTKYGQLGNGSTATTTKTYTKSPITDIIDIAVAIGVCLVLKKDGTIYTIGQNTKGQLGQGDTTARRVYTKVEGIDNVKSVHAGSYFLVILKNDGSLWGTGTNYGQFNNGSSSGNITKFIKITDNVETVFVGYSHIAYIKKDGNFYVVGPNSYGQLGLGNTTSLTTETKNTLINDSIDTLFPYVTKEVIIKYLIKSLSKYYTINSSNILEETTSDDIENGITIDKINENIDILPDSFSLVGAEEKSIKYSGLKDELLIQNEYSNMPYYDNINNIISEFTNQTGNHIKFIFKLEDGKWYTYLNSDEFIEITFEVEENSSNKDLWITTKNNILSMGIDITNIDKLTDFLNERNTKSIKFAFVMGSDILDSVPSIKSINIDYNGKSYRNRLKKSEYDLELKGKNSMCITTKIDLEKLYINIL